MTQNTPAQWIWKKSFHNLISLFYYFVIFASWKWVRSSTWLNYEEILSFPRSLIEITSVNLEKKMIKDYYIVLKVLFMIDSSLLSFSVLQLNKLLSLNNRIFVLNLLSGPGYVSKKNTSLHVYVLQNFFLSFRGKAVMHFILQKREFR